MTHSKRPHRLTFLFLPVLLLLAAAGTATAGTYRLSIDALTVNFTGTPRPAMAINGSIPAPLLRFREGEEVEIHVTNNLDVDSSVHWHGFILPNAMDGVPGMTFPGIGPGETFTYRFTITQNGTYWYHSHSGLQEQAGIYGPIVIDPATPDPVGHDRDYVVMLSDWTDEKPEQVLANLKKQSDYYNYNQRTVGDFFRDIGEQGWRATLRDRRMWGEMRMTPTDIADVTGSSFLINGKTAEENWTAIFKAGERIRLRFINGSAMSYFDVKIPGLHMQVVAADGQNVEPVTVDAFRIAVAETYDVIVTPERDMPFTIFAQAMDRSGYARATLAPRPGMAAAIPPMDPRKLLTMADMGHDMHDMNGMEGNDKMEGTATMSGRAHDMAPANQPAGAHMMPHSDPPTMKQSPMQHHMQHDMPQNMQHDMHAGMAHTKPPEAKPNAEKSHEHAQHDGGDAHPQATGVPLDSAAPRVLRYGDLRSLDAHSTRMPTREIALRLTGNMERYFWSINDKKYSEAEPIRLRYNERVRIKFVNQTMMTHPMHLHGHWMELDNGAGAFKPRKHVISIAPGETVYFDLTADAVGDWAFHCHLLYHMATGMFRKLIVEPAPEAALDAPAGGDDA